MTVQEMQQQLARSGSTIMQRVQSSGAAGTSGTPRTSEYLPPGLILSLSDLIIQAALELLCTISYATRKDLSRPSLSTPLFYYFCACMEIVVLSCLSATEYEYVSFYSAVGKHSNSGFDWFQLRYNSRLWLRA